MEIEEIIAKGSKEKAEKFKHLKKVEDCRNKIEDNVPRFPVQPLKQLPNEKEQNHIEQEMWDTDMQKSVRYQSPILSDFNNQVIGISTELNEVLLVM